MPTFKNLILILIMLTSSNIFSFEEGVTSNNGIEIYYRDYGPIDGDPILLVQGLGGQLINWPPCLLYTSPSPRD